MKRIIASIAALLMVAGVGMAAAAPAQADSKDRNMVRLIMQNYYFEADYDDAEFMCDWWKYDRKDFYRQIYRNVWAEEGVSYKDMRIGIYRAFKPLC